MENKDKQTFVAVLRGQDELCLEQKNESHGLATFRWIGCSAMAGLIHSYQRQYGMDLTQWPIPTESSHVHLLLKELLLKLQGKWQFPILDLELCHCRQVATATVDEAVVSGAHDVLTVARWTSASTACGTCRPDIEKIIEFRLRIT